MIAFDNDREQWVSFKYERLANLYFWCGCLTYNDKDCDLWIKSEGKLAETEKQYEPWIKAPLFNGKHRPVVSVPGFYTKKVAKPTGERPQKGSHKWLVHNVSRNQNPPLDVTTFDHKPLWIAPEGIDSSFHKLFRFEQMWLTDKGCNDIVEAVWKERVVDPWDTRVINKIDKSGRELSRWSKKCFGSVRWELEKKKRKQLQYAEKEAA